MNFIDGRWTNPLNDDWYEKRNPATAESIGSFPDSGKRDVDAAVSAAANAATTWRRTPAPERAELLRLAADQMRQSKSVFAKDMTIEMGKTIRESHGDVQYAIDMSEYMSGEGRRSFGITTPSAYRNRLAMTLRQPHGVVAALTPWNFPMAIPSWKIMAALVAGNTVVLKPSPLAPLSAINLVRCLESAGAPAGVINLVLGGSEAGISLVHDPRVAMISFTGSVEVGRQIAVDCARLGKRLLLELGGKNAIIVLDDADLELAAEGCVRSAFAISGQRCTAASRLIVQRTVADEFARLVAEGASRLLLGDPLDQATDVGPLVDGAQLAKVEEYVAAGEAEGATLLCGGGRGRVDGLEQGLFYMPTVFSGVRPDVSIAQEEIFGPVVDIIPCSGLEDAISINNDVRFGLVSSIYTRSLGNALEAVEEMRSGAVYVNSGTLGAEVHLPFGGVGDSGNGPREAGQAALDSYTEWKTVYINYSTS